MTIKNENAKQRYHIQYVADYGNGMKRVQRIRSFKTTTDAKEFINTINQLSPSDELATGTRPFRKNNQTKADINIWSYRETAQFLKVFKEEDCDLVFELIVDTGVRLGELSALSWTDVDLNTGKMKIYKSTSFIGSKFYIHGIRSDRRVVDLSASIIERLKNHKDKQEQLFREMGEYSKNTYNLIFTHKNGNGLRPDYLKRQFSVFTKKAGVKEISINALRPIKK